MRKKKLKQTKFMKNLQSSGCGDNREVRVRRDSEVQ